MDPKKPGVFSDFSDELEETAKDVVKIAKKQVASKPTPATPQDDSGKKVDPVTGKPTPSKRMLTQLNQQVAQLAQMRLKKVREELENQRLKTKEPAKASNVPGPEVRPEPEKPKEDIVQKTLKASKSTGEFKGLIGG